MEASIVPSLRVMTSRPAEMTAAVMGTITAHWNAEVPGRIITSTPTKPIITATQPFRPTRSRNRIADMIVRMTGLTKTTAMASARGSTAQDITMTRLHRTASTPRSRVSFGARGTASRQPPSRRISQKTTAMPEIVR